MSRTGDPLSLLVAGVSHHTAPVEVRERLAYAPGELVPVVARLREAPEVREAVLLSTCNRTEFYIVAGSTPERAASRVWSTLSERLGADVAPYAYLRRDRDAVAHLFRVAAGLDSMILGESQVHGQVRDAWEHGRAQTGVVLNRLFQTALRVGARVRDETGVARGAASVSSAAVQLAKKIFGSLQGRRAMVLGAGDSAEIALACLRREGVRATVVANRTFERADEVARRHGATALRFDDCWPELATVDVLLCSTAAPHPVVTASRLRAALAGRGDRPLCILDIALPRDVEPGVGELENVYLYDLDDLQAAVAANLERRRDELPSAEQVIAAEVERYWEWLAGLATLPVLTRFRGEMDRLRERELSHVLRKLHHLSPDERAAVEHFSRSLMNKFLHAPTVRLRAAAANGRGLGIVDAVQYLFALDEKSTRRETRVPGDVSTRGDASPSPSPSPSPSYEREHAAPPMREEP